MICDCESNLTMLIALFLVILILLYNQLNILTFGPGAPHNVPYHLLFFNKLSHK